MKSRRRLLLPLIVMLPTIANSFILQDIPSQQYYIRQYFSYKRSAKRASMPLQSSPTFNFNVETQEATKKSLPIIGKDGIYEVVDEDQYRGLIEMTKDKLVVLKVFAPWCKACKSLAPQFIRFSKDKKYEDLPIVWAELTCKGNKELINSMKLKQIPTVRVYAYGEVKTSFPCKPSRMPILKNKLDQLVEDHVDPNCQTLKQSRSFPKTDFADLRSSEHGTWSLELHQPKDRSEKPTFKLDIHLDREGINVWNLDSKSDGPLSK